MKKSDLLIFKGYELEKMKIEKADTFKENGNFSILYKIIPNNSKIEKANVIQGILIEANKDFPYNIVVVLRGNFVIGTEVKENKRKELLTINAAAIMFPYLRSSVSLMSSQTEYNKIILPTVNFNNLISIIDENKIFIDEKKFIDFE